MNQSAVCITGLLAYECVFDMLFWLLAQKVYFAKDKLLFYWPLKGSPNKNPENTNEKVKKKQEKTPIDSFEIFSQI